MSFFLTFWKLKVNIYSIVNVKLYKKHDMLESRWFSLNFNNCWQKLLAKVREYVSRANCNAASSEVVNWQVIAS